jgi:hypothetical protein
LRFVYLLLPFDFCAICTGSAESNAARFDFMEEIIVIECVTGGFESRICRHTVKLIISHAREWLILFVFCDKLASIAEHFGFMNLQAISALPLGECLHGRIIVCRKLFGFVTTF